MSKRIVPDQAESGKCLPDLICPQPACRARCCLVPARFQIHCPTCGWGCALTYPQQAELLDALHGISDLPLAAYLQILAAQTSSLPPASGQTASCGKALRARWPVVTLRLTGIRL